jgi:cystathionine beta-lyase/cystathionine gamma-synthase
MSSYEANSRREASSILLKEAQRRSGSAERFIDTSPTTPTITLAVSLGLKTLIKTHFLFPRGLAPRTNGPRIEPGGVRLSVGLEDWRLIEDLRQALDHVDIASRGSASSETILAHRL